MTLIEEISPLEAGLRLSTAPMMDWSDRHCRYLFRLIAPGALLYTEMVTAGAILHGDAHRFLDFDDVEHPVALQLGGSEPSDLAAAVRKAEPYGYDEINLNCGCPSERVQKGAFGASLMAEPGLVADCVRAMQDATAVPVTVKCRIGIDDAPVPGMLRDFVGALRDAGVGRFIIHARCAWLKGLSPKENREIPPLRHDVVEGLKAEFEDAVIVLNGGITAVEQAVTAVDAGLDGVMLGRQAYYQPLSLGAFAKQLQPGAPAGLELPEILEAMRDYARRMMTAHDVPLHHVTRHMLGLAHGMRGARDFRRRLGEGARQPGARPELILEAGEALLARAQAA